MDLHIEFKLASSKQACELFKCFHMPVGYIEEEKKDEDEESVADSGYGTPSISQEKLVDVDPVPPVNTSDINFVGSTHKSKAPKLSYSQVKELAQQFADAVPEREFSMAELQGYLMTYKTRPFEAVSCAEKWVADQRIAKAADAVKPETAKS
jgi:chaperone BCS1